MAVEVRAQGYRTWRRSIDVAGGATTREAVALEPEVVIEAVPSAPPVSFCVPGFALRGGLCWPVGEGPSSPGGRSWRVAGWVALGAAVVSGGAAIGLGLDGAATESAYLARCGGASVAPACAGDRALTQSALDDRASLVNGLWAAAGLSAAFAVTALLVDGSTPRVRRVGFAPSGMRIAW